MPEHETHDSPNQNIDALVERVAHLEMILNSIILSDKFLFQKPLIGGPNGLRLGSVAKDKLAFYNAAPIAQPNVTNVTTNHNLVGGTNIQTFDTFDGATGTTAYNIPSLIRNLKNIGILKT